MFQWLSEIINAKDKALDIIVGLYRYKGIEFEEEEKIELSKELTTQIKDKVIEYVYSNDNATYSEAMIVINYFLLQLYRGIGLSVEEVVYDPCKTQFLVENELFESGGEVTIRIELYNSLINPIKEAINTLVNCIKSIYKANNLVFKEEEEKIVSENLIYELSDILIHYIYTDESATYKSSIDKINEYMVEFIGRFIKIKDDNEHL